MDGMTLLGEAQACGLIVTAVGPMLVVRGPKRAEGVALRLLAHKAGVLAALHSSKVSDPPDDPPLRHRWLPDDEMSISDRCKHCDQLIVWGKVDFDSNCARPRSKWIPLDPDWPFPHRCGTPVVLPMKNEAGALA